MVVFIFSYCVHEKVTNIVIAKEGRAFYWRSFNNKFHPNTATNLYPIVKEEILQLVSHGVSIVAAVADNEPLNYAIIQLLRNDFPFLAFAPCSAHTMNLCVSKILKLPDVAQILNCCKDILILYNKKKEIKEKLYSLQLTNNPSATPLVLLEYSATRWSSQLISITRILELQSYVDLIMKQSPDFWVKLKSLQEFLGPFRVATDNLQKDSSTLLVAYEEFT
jgi:hypothetical protein